MSSTRRGSSSRASSMRTRSSGCAGSALGPARSTRGCADRRRPAAPRRLTTRSWPPPRARRRRAGDRACRLGQDDGAVERVRELLARGADARTDPVHDVQRRRRGRAARAADARRRRGVAARTFHSVGHRIIRAHGVVDGRELHAEVGPSRSGRGSPAGGGEVGAPVPEAAELPNEISAIRLGELVTAEEWERGCPDDDRSRVRRARLLAGRAREGAPAALRLRRHDRPRRAPAAHRPRASGSAGSRRSSTCWSTSTRTSSRRRSCSCGCSPRRTTTCSSSATRTRRCTAGGARACTA